MHRVKNLVEPVCSFENLRVAARNAPRGKRSQMPGAAFFGDLEKELVSLQHELATGTYEHGGYHYFRIFEPKERLVAGTLLCVAWLAYRYYLSIPAWKRRKGLPRRR